MILNYQKKIEKSSIQSNIDISHLMVAFYKKELVNAITIVCHLFFDYTFYRNKNVSEVGI